MPKLTIEKHPKTSSATTIYEGGSGHQKLVRVLGASAIDNFTYKLAEKFSGPYTVTSIIQANIVDIKDERGKALRAHV